MSRRADRSRRVAAFLIGLSIASAPMRAAEEASVTQAMRLAGEAVAAVEAGDTQKYLSKMEEAAELRPDIPRILTNLAAAQTAAEEPQKALATLERLAALGLDSPIDRAEEFAPLKSQKGFAELVKKFAANRRSVGRGEIAFTVPEVRGLIEGIAWREKTGAFYFGDVHSRAIWLRTKDGKVRRFTAESEELLGVFGLVLDEANGALWAATSAVPAMRDYAPEQQGAAALVEIDLATGELRRAIAPPPPARGPAIHQFNDLVLAGDGSVWVTDSGEPHLWRLAPGANTFDRPLHSPEFISLQGIAITPAGVAVVADRINGLLRVELGSGDVSRFEPPANTTLVGIDGLVLGKGNSVFALQAGLRPTRVLRVDFDAAVETVRSVTVLEAGHLSLVMPTLGCIGPSGDCYFVGNGGWPRFETGNEPTAPRPVPIFKIALGAKR